MPGIKERRKTWVSTADSGDYSPTGYDGAVVDGEEPKHYCLKCESYGFPYQELGERIYKDEELINGQIPHDSDLWLQCYRCGSIIPSGHGKQEGHIKGFIDVPDSIHDTRRLKIEHFIEPRHRHRRGKIHKDSTALPDIEKDKDIQQLTTDSGRELTNYSDG